MPGLPPLAPPLKAVGMHDDRGGRPSSGQGEGRRWHGNAGGKPAGGGASAKEEDKGIGVGGG